MSNFLIKVCGITRMRDAELSLELGANALGFNFYPQSPRYIKVQEAQRLIRQLSGDFLPVAVVVASEGLVLPDIPDEIEAVQVHGVNHERDLPVFKQKVIAAVSPENVDCFPGTEVIIDTSWGRGLKADWNALRGISRPYILSGGLNPENVEEAIRLLRPAGIDVCSGIEARPGTKDEKKLSEFLSRVSKLCWKE